MTSQKQGCEVSFQRCTSEASALLPVIVTIYLVTISSIPGIRNIFECRRARGRGGEEIVETMSTQHNQNALPKNKHESGPSSEVISTLGREDTLR